MALSQEQILAIPEPLVEHFQRLERDIVAAIARHIGKLNFAYQGEIGALAPNDVHQLDQLQKVGFNLEEIQSEIARVTQRAQNDIFDLFNQAAKREYDRYREVFDLTGKQWVPFAENTQLATLIEQVTRATDGQLRNISGTLGFVGTDGNWQELASFYQQQIDYAVYALKTGQTSVMEAMRSTVRNMADKGVTQIEWSSGYKRRMDSSVRQNILGGLAQLSREQAKMVAEQVGADGMEISFHLGYRPTHDFGGLQFDLKEFAEEIEPLMNEPNCYHRAFPIVLGISTPAYTDEQIEEMKAENERIRYFEGKPYDRYRAEQRQRRYELEIRKQRDRINAFEAMGDHEADIARGRLRQVQANYKKFSAAVGLRTKPQKTQAA